MDDERLKDLYEAALFENDYRLLEVLDALVLEQAKALRDSQSIFLTRDGMCHDQTCMCHWELKDWVNARRKELGL